MTLNKRVTICKKHADNRVTTTYKYATDFKKSANRKPVPGQGGKGGMLAFTPGWFLIEATPHLVLKKQPTRLPCGLENILTKD
jgi:hypothetical protein